MTSDGGLLVVREFDERLGLTGLIHPASRDGGFPHRAEYIVPLGGSFPLAIGVGRTNWLRSPLPPNRTGGSPASGSPVGGVTYERVDKPTRGATGGMPASGNRNPRDRPPLPSEEGRQHA